MKAKQRRKLERYALYVSAYLLVGVLALFAINIPDYQNQVGLWENCLENAADPYNNPYCSEPRLQYGIGESAFDHVITTLAWPTVLLWLGFSVIS